MALDKIIELGGSGMKLAGNIWGNIASASAARKARRQVNEQLDKQQDRATREFESQYYADPRQLASNQVMLTEMQKYLQEQRQARAAANAVTGGTEETLAAQKAIDNQTVASTMANLASQNETRRAKLRDQYNSDLSNIDNARIANIKDYNAQKQQAIASTVSSINKLGDSMSKSGYELNNQKS